MRTELTVIYPNVPHLVLSRDLGHETRYRLGHLPFRGAETPPEETVKRSSSTAAGNSWKKVDT